MSVFCWRLLLLCFWAKSTRCGKLEHDRWINLGISLWMQTQQRFVLVCAASAFLAWRSISSFISKCWLEVHREMTYMRVCSTAPHPLSVCCRSAMYSIQFNWIFILIAPNHNMHLCSGTLQRNIETLKYYREKQVLTSTLNSGKKKLSYIVLCILLM